MVTFLASYRSNSLCHPNPLSSLNVCLFIGVRTFSLKKSATLGGPFSPAVTVARQHYSMLFPC